MLKIHNTLTRKNEDFNPLKEGEVTIYTCGPTVYDTAHVGNLRTYISADLVAKSFSFLGYTVKNAMNITDIDDKTIKRSKENNISLKELTDKYEKLFLEDIKKLNILPPTFILSARESIPEMIDIIKILLENGHAYKADDGVYFKVSSDQKYGRLVGKNRFENKDLSTEQVHTHTSHSRIANDEYDKENISDFALWKFYKPEDGENYWEADFGKGRPGWHIECSAMSRKALGQPFDIHMGATDLIFPHHTNEMAQSECAYGADLAKYWIHSGFLNVNDEKMAKSKKNFHKLADLEEQGFSPLAFRYLTMNSHYRSQMNFTWESLTSASNSLKNLHRHINTLPDGGRLIESAINEFKLALEDDFNIPVALAVLHKLVSSGNLPEDIKTTAIEFDKVLSLSLIRTEESEIPEKIAKLAEERKIARDNKDWKKSDDIRNIISEAGFEILDKKDGSFQIVKK